MDANLLRQQQQQQLNSGLMRYRSAPSTLLANFIDGGDCGTEGCDDFIPSHHHRSSSPEGESMFARFMNCGGDDSGSEIREDKSPATATATATANNNNNNNNNSNNNNRNCQFMVGGGAMEHGGQEQQNGFSQMMYHQTPPPRPQQAHMNHNNHHHSSSSSNLPENAYRVVSSMGMDHQVKMESGNNSSNLIRHSSSPAGLFSHLNVENGYGVMRGMGNFRGGNGSNGEAAAGSSSRLKGQVNFSSGPPSSSGLMSQISEIGSESIGGGSNGDGGSLGNGNAANRYLHSFPVGSWDDSALENITGLKRARDVSNKMVSSLNSSDSQNGEVGNHTSGLTHHFSLPKTSAEMAAILQFQDSVPCKIRAKRGCATHPRSIAERVRRTRISERMRKLQELVPNMDKQTNTADMLDLAVEYIKDLQKQVKMLSESRANCTCSNKQKAY